MHAVIAAHQTSPSEWTKTTLDQILESGDKLYCELVPETNKYLLFKDIPAVLDNYAISVHESLCGTLRREKTEKPFYAISDAINELMNDDSSCLFTMGQCSPSYTCAIIRNPSEFYFFDPHSRADTGMVTADGLATLTVHKHTQSLSLFIKHLAASMGNAGDGPFEIAKITVTEKEIASDSESDFSGYSTLSEGDVACKLFLAEEIKNSVVDPSDVSDASSISSFDTSSICSIDSAVLENLEHNLHDSFLQSFNDEVFESTLGDSDAENASQKFVQNTFGNEKSVDGEHIDSRIYDEDNMDDNEFDDYDDDFLDKDYDPNESKETDEDDDEYYYDHSKGDPSKIKQNDLRSDDGSLNALNNGMSQVASESGTQHTQVTNDDKIQHTQVTSDNGTQCKQVTSNSCENREVTNDNIHVSQSTQVNGNLSQSTKVTCDHTAQSTQVQRDNNSQSTQVSGDNMASKEKRGRKRKRNEENWKRNIHKRQRNTGKSYVSRTGKIRSARTLKRGCAHTCRYKCKSKFSESERQSIFHSYWQLGDVDKQRQFIAKYATIKIKSKNGGGKRKWTVTYTLPQIQENGKSVAIKVCKTFFQDTIGITDSVVKTVLKKLSAIGVCMEDNRGKHNNRPNRASQSQITGVRKHIESFQPIESHYCRKDSAKKYLPADLNVTKMYDMYTENCPLSEKPASINIYRRIFNEEYNISFHTPLKDQCDLCAAFRNAGPEEKENMRQVYEKHIRNKELAKQNKESDKLKMIKQRNL